MCIAIHRKKGGVLSKKTLWNCWENNPDGAGFMYADGGKLIIVKGFFKFKPFWKAVRDLIIKDDRELVLHFRIATSGKVDYDNCHPHLINDGLAYVHNGIISELNDDQTTCDTIRFAEMLRQLPKDFIHIPGIMKLIEMSAGYNKFVFMDSDGNVRYTNEDAGVETEGVWYSNTGYRYSKSWLSSVSGYDYKYDRGYSHGFSYGHRGSYSEPICLNATKAEPTAEAQQMTEDELTALGYSDEEEFWESLPASARFESYQRYDGDFMPLDEGCESVEDEYGLTEYDYVMMAEEEVEFWQAHPAFLAQSAYKDICEIDLDSRSLRFILQSWLDQYEPNYQNLYRSAAAQIKAATTEEAKKKNAIAEVINATAAKLTQPTQLAIPNIPVSVAK